MDQKEFLLRIATIVKFAHDSVISDQEHRRPDHPYGVFADATKKERQEIHQKMIEQLWTDLHKVDSWARDLKLNQIAKTMLGIPSLSLQNQFAKANVELVNLKSAMQLAWMFGSGNPSPDIPDDPPKEHEHDNDCSEDNCFIDEA